MDTRFTTQQASSMNQWANSDMPLFRGRPLHHVDTSRTSEQFVEINYMRIGLSIADITAV
jgi:hypothetical protein